TEPGVPTDGRARELAGILPSPLKPYARIITGLQIQTQQGHAGTDHGFTKFGQFVNGTSQAAATAGHSARRALSRIDPATAGMVAAGVGLTGLTVAGLSWLGTALAAGMAVALADPALV